jgi:hypothetical protein
VYQKLDEKYLKYHGIPPNIKINKTTIIIPAIITGIRNLSMASITIAIITITKRARNDPLYDKIIFDRLVIDCEIKKTMNVDNIPNSSLPNWPQDNM